MTELSLLHAPSIVSGDAENKMICQLDAPFSVAAEWADRSDDHEEAGWIARACEGDHAAFGWLLSRYRQRAVRLAAHVLRRPEEAEDIAQEAFVRAFRSLRSYRGDGRFYTWLYHIVIRLCLDRRRLARWSSEIQADGPIQDLVRCGSSESEVADSRLLVETLLDRLSPPMRAALVLRELEGLDYEEIACVLRIPVGTVRSRLNSARAQFRDIWLAAQRETDHV